MSQTVNLSNSTPAPPPGAVNVNFQNDNASPPNISANMPSGVGGASNIVARTVLTAQSAAIAATTLLAIGAGLQGMYRVGFVATVTQAAGGGSPALGGTTGFQLKYTNIADSVVKTSNPTTPTISAVNAVGTSISGDLYAYCNASTNLQFLFGYTGGTGATFTYDITVFVEYLGG